MWPTRVRTGANLTIRANVMATRAHHRRAIAIRVDPRISTIGHIRAVRARGGVSAGNTGGAGHAASDRSAAQSRSNSLGLSLKTVDSFLAATKCPALALELAEADGWEGRGGMMLRLIVNHLVNWHRSVNY